MRFRIPFAVLLRMQVNPFLFASICAALFLVTNLPNCFALTTYQCSFHLLFLVFPDKLKSFISYVF